MSTIINLKIWKNKHFCFGNILYFFPLFRYGFCFIECGIFIKRGIILDFILRILSISLLLLFPIIVLPKQKLNLIMSIVNSKNRLKNIYNRIIEKNGLNLMK
ncbi:hypothetical protein FG386_001150 [Cryptosporidium ryanae]|uniref:uncharacterized protein n=1 Tax=Cryptosporidium ryanae TaxID=515981 RepID=UPI00351A687A|nr:hypothetical protein FG386_001150 [Cryptosporidium ryanae]